MALLRVLQRLGPSRAAVYSRLIPQTPWNRSLAETSPCSSASCQPSDQSPYPMSHSKRLLHTSAVTASNAGGLEEVLRKKSELQEAGQGRIVIDQVKGKLNKSTSPGGRMELRVPHGTDRVRIRVSLVRGQDGEAAHSMPQRFGCGEDGRSVSSVLDKCTKDPQTTNQTRLMASNGKSQSWFSIKDIRNKLPGCRREESAPAPEPTTQPHTVPACPPARPPCSPSPPACPPPRPTKDSVAESSHTSKTPPVCGQQAQKPECGAKKFSSAAMLLPDALAVSS